MSSPAKLIPLAAVSLALAAAAPAAADSIAYVKDGDVFVTDGGSRTTQVTRTGDNFYVSQADDGTLATLAPGERLRTIGRDGRVLAEFPTFVSDGAPVAGPVNQFSGPFEPEISPDGKLVAFEWFNHGFDGGNTPDCSETSVPSCYEIYSSQGVGISRTSGFTGFEAYGLLTGWIGPQWLSNTKLLRSFSNSALNEDAVFDEVGSDADPDRWFYDETGALLYEVELSRDRQLLAAIAGWNDEQLRIYRPLVEPFGAPDPDMSPFAKNPKLVEQCVAIDAPDGERFESVSISPDARRIAYATEAGLWLADLNGCGPTANPRLVVPGGRHPHFGPAGVPDSSSTGTPGSDVGRPAAGALKLRAPRVVKARVARRRGIAVVAKLPAAGRVVVTGKLGGRRAARIARTGKGAVRLRVKVRRARPGRLRLTATYRPAGAPAQRATAVVRLRRG